MDFPAGSGAIRKGGVAIGAGSRRRGHCKFGAPAITKEVLAAFAGIGIGAALALVASRLLKSLLFGISPADPLTYASVALLLMGVALRTFGLPPVPFLGLGHPAIEHTAHLAAPPASVKSIT